MSDSKVHEKLDKIVDRLGAVDVHLARYNAQLEYHIQRTDALEVMVLQTDEDLKPLVAHVEQIRGVGKFIGYVGTIVSILAAIIGGIMWWLRHG